MSTYQEAGVNVSLGDESSRLAYNFAKETFPGRKGLIGAPLIQDGGFAGALDFGAYYLVMGDDGVGTKMEVAVQANNFDMLGEDLLAMVADDAICVGAEVVSITNTIDANRVQPEQIRAMMHGLKNACLKQKIVIAGGEIAELGAGVQNLVWNATALGIVEKSKLIDTKRVAVGDQIIALKSCLFRSNGFSLVRYILKQKFGKNWVQEPYDQTKTWGEVTLTPCKIYHHAVLELIGRYQQPRQIEVHGIAHITGGGIPGNLNRILKANQVGANLTNLYAPQEPMLKLQEYGQVEDLEAYRTWNMGNGMLMAVAPQDAPRALKILEQNGIEAQICGEVISEPKIHLHSQGFFHKGKVFEFKL